MDTGHDAEASPQRGVRRAAGDGASLPWMAWSVGQRAVVRYQADDGVHDALGTLLEVEPDHVTVRARRGVVRVAASTMIVGKLVPPPRRPRSAE